MDSQNFIALSKFTVEARKVIGTINPAKLLKDPVYCAAVFRKVDDSDNTELILLASGLRDQLGLAPEKHPDPNDESAKALHEALEKNTAKLPADKYLFGARG